MGLRLFPVLALLTTLLAVPLVVPPSATAQTQAERRRARRLFSQGVRFSDRRRWNRAASRFRRALELVDAPAIRYNLAAALLEQGEFQEASDMLGVVEADEAAPEGIRDAAVGTRRQLEARAARMTIELDGATGNERVLVDGTVLSATALQSTRWLEPGSHRVEVQRDGATVAEEARDIAAGASAQVRLAMHVAALVIPEPERQVEPELEREAERSPMDERGSEAAPASDADVPIIPTEDEHLYAEDDEGGSGWVLWVALGGALVIGAGVALLLTTGGETEGPIAGNFMPGIATW